MRYASGSQVSPLQDDGREGEAVDEDGDAEAGRGSEPGSDVSEEGVAHVQDHARELETIRPQKLGEKKKEGRKEGRKEERKE